MCRCVPPEERNHSISKENLPSHQTRRENTQHGLAVRHGGLAVRHGGLSLLAAQASHSRDLAGAWCPPASMGDRDGAPALAAAAIWGANMWMEDSLSLSFPLSLPFKFFFKERGRQSPVWHDPHLLALREGQALTEQARRQRCRSLGSQILTWGWHSGSSLVLLELALSPAPVSGSMRY